MDYRMDIINQFARSLGANFNSEQISIATGLLSMVLDKYEVTERCTDVTVREDDSEQLIALFLSTLISEGKSVRTIKHYNNVIHYFLDDLQIPVSMITSLDIMRWIAIRRKRGACNNTLNNYRNCVSSFYNWLSNEKVIKENPFEHVKGVKHPKKVVLPFMPEDVDVLRSACHSKKVRAIIEVLHSTGIRCNELVNIKLRDVDFVGKSIIIREGKGGKQRQVYFNGICATHLNKYLMSEKRDSEYLFRKYGGGQMETKNVQDFMRKLGKEAGIPKVHAHRFRHTFAFNAYRSGMDIKNIQRLLGHSNINQTMEYIHISDQFIETEYRRRIV